MKISKCRSCKNSKINKTFSLGKQAFTGIFPKYKNETIPSGELSLVYCDSCNLLQLENSFDKKKLYGDNYGYMSSLNSSMTSHLSRKANLLKKYNLINGDLIIDIGSNDGTFLSFFQRKFNLIGIDPTIKKFRKNYRKDIIKVENFFSKNALITYTKKKAKLITSIAMFYDLEDPIKFAEDVYELLDKDGIWHLELSYMPLMIKNLSYDTICHEHLEYYSLNSIKYIFDKVGFTIIDIQLNDINGGSFALTLSKNKNSNNKVVEWLLNQESKDNINNISTFKNFFLKISKQKKDLKNLLENLIDMKKKVYGYGASTKGNVILQFSNINSKLLPLIGEVNPFKFNRYTPGTKIKIVSEAAIKKNKPDYLLVLPWHFKDFIIKKEKKYLDSGGKLIFPLPQIEII
jgi:hypothetical protein